MKVMLVQPNRSHGKLKTSHPHMGIASLAAYSLTKGHETSALDALYEGLNNETVLSRIAAFKPSVLGLTAKTPDILECEKIAKQVKQLSPDTSIVIGGAHITALRERVLQECPFFDYGVFGEGEITFSELLDAIEGENHSFAAIKGVIYREEGAIRINDPRPFIKDVDKLLFPAWQLFPGGTDLPLFTSRGCPFRCIFCQRVMGDTVRVMSPERVVSDMEKLINEHNARFLQIEDETFGVDKKWTRELLELMIAKEIHKKIKWAANSRVNIADLEIYKLMKTAGCGMLGFGIESGNQQILNNVHKGFKLKEAEIAIATVKKAGLKSSAFFILGHPNETPSSAMDTINFACRLNPDEISFGMMIPYPGTEIYELAKANKGGYRNLSENWAAYTKYFGGAMECVNFKKGQLEWLQKRAYIQFYIKNWRLRELADIFSKYFRKQS
jgi:anaerobic magnesium-protoporphyrin IX monomethyl ester cyclase